MINLKPLQKSALSVMTLQSGLKDHLKRTEVSKLSAEILKLASRSDLVIMIFDKQKTNDF